MVKKVVLCLAMTASLMVGVSFVSAEAKFIKLDTNWGRPSVGRVPKPKLPKRPGAFQEPKQVSGRLTSAEKQRLAKFEDAATYFEKKAPAKKAGAKKNTA